DPDSRRAFGCQVLAPGNYLHVEGKADPGDGAAEPAEPEYAQGLALDAIADAGLPQPLAHRAVVVGDPTGGAEDQAPGELGGIQSAALGPANRDAMVAQRRQIKRGVAHSGRDQELELRQPFDEAAREGRALAHRRDDLGLREGTRGFILIGEGFTLDDDIGTALERRPVRHIERHALVVVENAKPHVVSPACVGVKKPWPSEDLRRFCRGTDWSSATDDRD